MGPPRVPSDAVHLASGVSYAVTRPGTGRLRPGPGDRVLVRYRAWDGEGRVVAEHGTAVSRVVADLGPAPGEVLQLVVAGTSVRCWVPPHLQHPAAGAGAGTAAVYELDLLDVTRLREPRRVPPELRSPGLDEPFGNEPG